MDTIVKHIIQERINELSTKRDLVTASIIHYESEIYALKHAIINIDVKLKELNEYIQTL